MFALAIMALLGAGEARASFFEHGPLSCSSPIDISMQTMGGNITVFATENDGTTHVFRVVGSSKDIPWRKMRRVRQMGFGPSKLITCQIDTKKVTGVANCTSYSTKRGWGGQCDYCARDASGAEKCRHVQGRLIETTHQPLATSPPTVHKKKQKRNNATRRGNSPASFFVGDV
jgi:hypothetical protein